MKAIYTAYRPEIDIAALAGYGSRAICRRQDRTIAEAHGTRERNDLSLGGIRKTSCRNGEKSGIISEAIRFRKVPH